MEQRVKLSKKKKQNQNYIWMFCKGNMHKQHGDHGKSCMCLWESHTKAQMP